LEALHVLETELAVNGPAATFFTDAELVTDRFPLVLTLIAPDGGIGPSVGGRPPKRIAGPYSAIAPSLSVAVIAVDEPPGGRVTDGLAVPSSPGGAVWPHPRRDDGLPKRLTSV
jgi:hypothetical protein